VIEQFINTVILHKPYACDALFNLPLC